MSRRKAYIELEEIPTLKQAYEERTFSPRNLKRATTLGPKYDHNEEFNKKISLIQADITKLRIDAIVNAANETLLGGGGVDGAIHRAAGPELRHECWDLNGCETGDAKITKGYDLPSKHVIHTVGPVGEKPHLLRSAYERSMQVMCENDLKSIAFSNISTGVYGYPRPKAGHIALDTMRKWLEQNSDYFDKLDRIIFCVFEDENKDVYETLFPVYFPPPVDINEYVKEEEKSRPKTNEEKKDNEAEKDKDQEKTLTSLTAEQVNKEIIGTDNNNGIKDKDEKKNHETLTTGQVNDKGLSADKDKENEEKNKDKDEDKGKVDVKEDKDKEDKDEENKEEVENKDNGNKEVENNDKEHKEEAENEDNTQNTDMYASTDQDNHDTGMSVKQDKKSTDVSTESNKQDNQATGAEPNKQDIQSTDVSTESNKQNKQVTEPIEQVKQVIQSTDVSTESNKQEKQVTGTEPMEQDENELTLNAATELDEANKQDEDTSMPDAATANEQVTKQNEQNSKKRSHDDTEAEQGDVEESRNNITTKDPDVDMTDAEQTTDAGKMCEQNEQSQKTSQTGGNILKNEDDNATKDSEHNNSKI